VYLRASTGLVSTGRQAVKEAGTYSISLNTEETVAYQLGVTDRNPLWDTDTYQAGANPSP
jgi:hypothetical protein